MRLKLVAVKELELSLHDISRWMIHQFNPWAAAFWRI